MNHALAKPTACTPSSRTLVCADAAAAIEFYKKAFGAIEESRLPGPGGKLMTEVHIGQGRSRLAPYMKL